MEPVFGEATRALLTQGLLGVLLVLALLAIVYLYRANQELHRARASDAEKLGAALERATAAQTTIADRMAERARISEELTRTLVEQGRAAETEFERLREKVDEIIRNLRRD